MLNPSLRVSLAFFLVLGCWWFLADHTRLPAWQVVVLPAAFLGFVVGRSFRDGPRVLVLVLVVVSLANAWCGEWLFFSAGIRRQFRLSALRADERDLQAVIIAKAREHQKLFEKADPAPLEAGNPSSPPQPPKSASATTEPSLNLLWRLYRETAGSRVWGLATSLVLSLLASFQAARMTLRRRA